MKTILLTLTLLLSGCTSSVQQVEKEYDYSDVTAFVLWNDIFKQEEKEYSVYFFSQTCGHCKELKQEIICYYFENVEILYFLETNEDTVFGPPSDLTGINSIEDFNIYGTPFLINIENGTVINYYAGSSKIREYIDLKTST